MSVLHVRTELWQDTGERDCDNGGTVTEEVPAPASAGGGPRLNCRSTSFHMCAESTMVNKLQWSLFWKTDGIECVIVY